MMSIPPEHAAELTQCYVNLARRLFGYARSVPGVDAARAEDLVQQAFETAATCWAELREQPEQNQLRFLCTVVGRDATDAYRRDRTAQRRQAEVWHGTQHRRHSDPFEAMRVLQLIEAFNKEIANMPPQRRRVSELKWGQQLNNQEIAVALDITVKAVSSHVAAARHALRKVRELLEGHDVSDREGGATDERSFRRR